MITRWSNRFIISISTLLCFTLSGMSATAFAAPQEDLEKLEAKKAPALPLSESTKRIIEAYKLKELANKDPVLAIVALDKLRTDAQEPAEEIAIAIAEIALRDVEKRAPELRAGLFLRAAVETYSESLQQAAAKGSRMVSEKGPLTTLGLYDRAVESLIDALQEADSEALAGTSVDISGPLTDYRLKWVNNAEGWTPATHDYVGSSIFERKKKDVQGLFSGLGVPIVAVRKGDLPDEPVFEGAVFPIYEYFYPLTAVLEISPPEPDSARAVALHFVDPREQEIYLLDDTEYPLATDLGAQLIALRREIDTQIAKGGVRHAGKYLSLMGLYASAPLRTDRIPAVFVHGLLSDAGGWDEAFDELVKDTELRKAYQAWTFVYPTGLPFPYSALFLRRALVETIDKLDPDGTNPLLQQAILVGHSMGGLLIRMNISDSGTTLWEAVFSKPPEEMDLEPSDLELITEALIVEPLPFVTRAVFFSVPHRGSKLASNTVGKMGASFVLLPPELRELGDRILLTEGDSLVGDAAERRKASDGIQTLQPEFSVIKALDKVPIDPTITYHSIIGDQGKGDSPDSSDGVVPYWSSHLDGAASEKIVPSGHGSYRDLEGIEELVRILHVHMEAVKNQG